MNEAPPPVQSPITGELRLGVIIDAAAQALAAMRPLPPAPDMANPPLSPYPDEPRDGDATILIPDWVWLNMVQQVQYTAALAEHRQKQQQLVTIGSVARAFLP